MRRFSHEYIDLRVRNPNILWARINLGLCGFLQKDGFIILGLRRFKDAA
jgi:hypothetical protein